MLFFTDFNQWLIDFCQDRSWSAIDIGDNGIKLMWRFRMAQSSFWSKMSNKALEV